MKVQSGARLVANIRPGRREKRSSNQRLRQLEAQRQASRARRAEAVRHIVGRLLERQA